MIQAIDVTFGYQTGRPVFAGWTATFEQGQAVAIAGPSGSGKSTALYLLGTLVRPWTGAIRFDGTDVAHFGDRERADIRAAKIGFVFQDALLDPRRSVLDNVIEGAVYRGDDRSRAAVRGRQLLKRFGVDVEADRPATHLSGGQAQRIGLCRALLNEPQVVLADEPTGNLDRANADLVVGELFSRAREGAVLVIATHDEALADRCDRIIFL
jgi:ABC-type lipoprotein export system ATPase subunit